MKCNNKNIDEFFKRNSINIGVIHLKSIHSINKVNQSEMEYVHIDNFT